MTTNKIKKGKLAIIDADAFLFYAGYHYKDNLDMLGEAAAKDRVDNMLSRLLDKIGATHYIGFFGKHGGKNFRYDFATMRPYKGNRDSPPWQEFFKPRIKKHYKDKWHFHEMDRIEADDATVIAFHQFKEDWNIIAVEEDKDGRQKGEFIQWNPRSDVSKLIKHTHEEGRKFFWSQCLHGDSTDNIGGVKGVGAGKKGGETSTNPDVVALWEMENPSEEEMFQHVKSVYQRVYPNDWLYQLTENYILLKMLDKPMFDYPKDIQPIAWRARPKVSPNELINL